MAEKQNYYENFDPFEDFEAKLVEEEEEAPKLPSKNRYEEPVYSDPVNSYDDVSLDSAGKPVIANNVEDFDKVDFSFPVPAPRFSKLRGNNNDEEDKATEREVLLDTANDEDDISTLFKSKATTIDIRRDVNKLWDEAVKELDRDQSLVDYIESKLTTTRTRTSRKASTNSYDSVAVPERRFKIVNGVQVPIPVTLLKNFDPYFEVDDEAEDAKEEDETSSTDDDEAKAPSAIQPSYENVWIPPPVEDDEAQAEDVENDDENEKRSSLASSATTASSSVNNDYQLELPVVEVESKKKKKKKLSLAKFGRRLSEQVIVKRRAASLAEDEDEMRAVTHSGPLRVQDSSERWTVLGENGLKYFNRRESLAEPKETIPLCDVLSVSKRTEAESTFCFDVAFEAKGNKLAVRTFSTDSVSARDTWVEKIAIALFGAKASSSSTSVDVIKVGWLFLKSMFAGEWRKSFVAASGNRLVYDDDDDIQSADLKKVKNVTLVKDVKNLNPKADATPVLVVDFIDRSLYLQSPREKEIRHWKSVIEATAFNGNGSGILEDHHVTKDGVPVIVERCVDFVFRHGALSEGVYRHSGVKTKIDKLLSAFCAKDGVNAWAVPMTRDDFSEHDVANVLKGK